MRVKERYDGIISWFSQHMPVAESELDYRTPYELLVAVVLSAQCTDKRVNIVTPPLFERYPDAEALSHSTPEEVFHYIRSVSYPNNKAKHLSAMGKMLWSEFEGVVPDTVETLQLLPGVGRKTANVIASVIYNVEVMPVDTHVFRVSERIGLTTNSKTPLQTELALIKYFPSHLLPIAHHWLILHGRYVCVARSPKCDECGISDWCRHYSRKTKAKQRLSKG